MPDEEFMKSVLFTVITKYSKYTGINFKKDEEINKTHVERNGNIFHLHGPDKLTSPKCPYYLPNYEVFVMKIPNCPSQIGKKLTKNAYGIANVILNNKSKAACITMSDFKTYYRTDVIKTA